MIHRLRRRHRRLWLALAVLLPVLYAVALAARRPAPVVDALPVSLRAAEIDRRPEPGRDGAGGAASGVAVSSAAVSSAAASQSGEEDSP